MLLAEFKDEQKVKPVLSTAFNANCLGMLEWTILICFGVPILKNSNWIFSHLNSPNLPSSITIDAVFKEAKFSNLSIVAITLIFSTLQGSLNH